MQPFGVQVVHRQHPIREPRAQALLKHQHPGADSSMAAAELVQIQLRHGVVNIEY